MWRPSTIPRSAGRSSTRVRARLPRPPPTLRSRSSADRSGHAPAVSRLQCKSENYDMDLTLDVNVELLPVEKDYKFSVELATTLNLDGTPDSGVYEQGQEKSADNRLAACDYAMHGKVFKYEQAKDSAKV